MADPQVDRLDRWLRIVEASWKPVAALAIPVIVALTPNFANLFTNDRKVDSIIVQEALSILKSEPKNEEDKTVREWAISVVERLSGETFSSAAREVLRDTSGPISQTAVNPDPLTPQEVIEAVKAAGLVDNGKLLDIALQEAGQAENPAGAPNPRIALYNESAGLAFDEATPWNAQFVNWVVRQAGYEGTNSARSRSWESWGKDSMEETGEYVAGCIMVAWRVGPTDGTGIAGFYTGREADGRYRILGGNLYNKVDAVWVQADRVVTCRLPPDWVGPAQ